MNNPNNLKQPRHRDIDPDELSERRKLKALKKKERKDEKTLRVFRGAA